MADLIQKITDGLADFRAQREKIHKDGDLSEDAKKRQVLALRDERLAALTQTAEVLWRELETSKNNGEAAIRNARAEANAQWDFQRLAYESNAVRSLLAGLRTVREMESLYQRVKTSGDPYRARAFADSAPAILAEGEGPMSDGMGVNALMRTLRTDAEAFTNTPKVQRAEAAATPIVDRILAGRDALKAVAGEFGLGGGNIFTSPNSVHPIVNMLSRLQVRQEVIHDDASIAPMMRVEVEFMPAGQSPSPVRAV